MEQQNKRRRAVASDELFATKPTQAVPPLREQAAGAFLVVGIGASAGGLDACRKLVSALPPDSGMAFILVQHLDPTHESMMVDLLATHTSMPVRQAADGMRLEPEHLYLIPPGTYPAVSDGALRLTQPQVLDGAHLPFDFLLSSLAEAYGPRAVCVVLSGAGADGSHGLKAVKERRGFVIVQDPAEAEYDGMPQSAIATGLVDRVLRAADIPAALVARSQRPADDDENEGPGAENEAPEWLADIIDLLRSKTTHDFTLYKPGTLLRRIEARMAAAGIEAGGTERYLALLNANPGELALLAKDLLINVTCFFRDAKVFDVLCETVVPNLVRNRAPDQPLRIWIAGCSTGEEAYSLAMLFFEEISAANLNIKLQVFASDVDEEAVDSAREGLYPKTIEADVSPARLARFFSKEEHGYRVLPELRAAVVFTVQDVLTDPPFSRLDLVSCRNLLIYLRPEAQARVLSLFHFALREGGILLLGSSEMVTPPDSRFAIVSKPARIYRHTSRSRPGELRFLINVGDGARALVRPGQSQAPSRLTALAELCRRLVLDTHAPAAVLINGKNECLYSLGPTDLYLRVPPGSSSLDLLAMARTGVRTKLRSAIQLAAQENRRVIVTGGQMRLAGRTLSFSIDVQPARLDGEPLLLVCFVDDPGRTRKEGLAAAGDLPKVAELELELETTRMELRGAIRNLEISNEKQAAIHEEALSVNEEYQSTNEELLTSKEELQSLNEELTALNSQLQETLERQRMTANDLQNVLYSTDIATLFLDTELNIRFFTPATKSLFRVIPGDVGRPLADLNSLAADSRLLSDARTILQTQVPIEREIEADRGAWYVRRILPYRTRDNRVEGVVITFTDITARKHAAKALEAAKQQAELANVAKSRFLASASHDLRQPLQALSLVQGILAKKTNGQPIQKLVTLMDHTLGAMSGMLNTLLDINQIDSGIVHAEIVDFGIGDLLARLRDEFEYHAQAENLDLRVVSCSLQIHSDPQLLEQMIRNLLANAMKYTTHGRVLLGCRRHGERLTIEVWDTGIGIPEMELGAIFEEYHQVDNAARERARGLGLGLSIVERLAKLLDHRVSVRSQQGKGSVFAIEVPLATHATAGRDQGATTADRTGGVFHRVGAVLVVEDDPTVRDLIEIVLKDEGHRSALAADGKEALELAIRGVIHPDIVLADYHLPNGMNGLELAGQLRTILGRDIPVVILTGDISTATLREIAGQDCVHLNKPVKLAELTQIIQRLLPGPPAAA